MIQTPRIAYRARDDATREGEVAALANVYRLVLSKKKQAVGRLPSPSGPDPREESTSDSRAGISIPRTS